MRLAVVSGEQDSQLQAAFGSQVHVVEAVLEVILVGLDGTKLGVGVPSVVEAPQ